MVAMRMMIGWHLLYEGVVKVANPTWSAKEFLAASTWIFSELFKSIAANETVLGIVNFLNEWGLILIGIGLIAGLFSRAATVSGIVLLGLYYLANPPLVETVSVFPVEGNYLLVNKTLIEMVALIVLLTFPTGNQIGLDTLLSKIIKKDTANG
jgi:thiosulfate dehydrogenase (quinone) large subunit